MRRAATLLVFSQVVLPSQLPFAANPLVHMTNSAAWMGKFANKPLTPSWLGV